MTAAAIGIGESTRSVMILLTTNRWVYRLVSAGLAWTWCAALASAQAPVSLVPAGWDRDLKLTEAVDRNPDPKIVEVDIVARIADVEVAPGKRVHAWTYNGGIPGPLIRTHVGDRLIVHFTNDLPDPTTIHWHGIRVPIEMDGVPGISQPEMKRGDTFTYDFIVRDAGLYWYHPHVMSAAQVGFGLYGAVLVEDPNDGVGIADELTLVLSDISFDERGEPADPNSGGPAGMVFGREGDYLLVNGKQLPTLRARSGAPQRWRIVNAAKSRFFQLDMDGQPFYVIGGDGGLQEYPVSRDTLVIPAGERADVIVAPKGPKGSTLAVRWVPFNRGYGSVEFRGLETLMNIEFTGDPAVDKVGLPNVRRKLDVPTSEGATMVDLVLTLPPKDSDGNSEFQVNGVPYWKAKPFPATVGEKQIWIVKNDSQYDHPMHFHGFFFLALDEKLQPIHPMVWKDTLNVPQHSTIRFLVLFDERPGMWMFHCHILDHAEGGLMGHVHLAPADAVEHVHP
jgi:FtsP/CotA-like multicopper oxidase with cupredoxin domain